MKANRKEILIFDTGSGAKFIASRLRVLLPNVDFKIITDPENAPYGNRADSEILSLIVDKLDAKLKQFSMCVIACNTATVNVIEDLRTLYPGNVFFGIEPMIKTASAISETRKVIILATEATKKSSRYKHLVDRYGHDLNILSPDTSGWASEIDANTEVDLTETKELAKLNDCDVVILGCSHYLAIENELKEELPGVAILEPSRALADVIKGYLHTQ